MARNNSGAVRKRIAFDMPTWHALHKLSLDSMKTVQELADEAFTDLLKKHRRPVTLKETANDGELGGNARRRHK